MNKFEEFLDRIILSSKSIEDKEILIMFNQINQRLNDIDEKLDKIEPILKQILNVVKSLSINKEVDK